MQNQATKWSRQLGIAFLTAGLMCGNFLTARAQSNETQAWVQLIKAKEEGMKAERLEPMVAEFTGHYPQSPFVPTAWYLLGDAYLENNNPQRADECYHKLLGQYSQLDFGPSILFRLGECQFNLGDIAQAKQAWSELLQHYPRSHLTTEIELAEAKWALHQEKFEEAKTRLQSLVSRYPRYQGNPDVVLGQARIAFSQQLYLAVLEQLAEMQTPEAVYLKGECWLALQKYFEVLAVFSRQDNPAVNDPDWLAVKEHLVWALLEHEQYTLAMEAAGKLAASAAPDSGLHADMLLVKANCLFSLKQYEAALAIYREWLDLANATDRAYVQFMGGLACCRLHQFDQAERFWGAIALEGMPKVVSDRLLGLIAQAYFSEQAWEQARAIDLKLCANNPGSRNLAEAYLRLAQASYKLGDDRQAMQAYAKFVQSEPQPRAAKNQKSLRPDLDISKTDDLETGSEKMLKFYAHDQDDQVPDLMLQASVLSHRQLPADYLDQYRTTPARNFSPKAAVPWLKLLAWPPILEVSPQKPAWNVQSWAFTVTDDHGEACYSLSGNESVPARILWDGKKKTGEWLGVGEPFQYSLTLVNTAGQPLSTVSPKRQLNSLAYWQEDKLQIRLLAKILFASGPPETLTPVGASWLKEIGSVLNQEMATKIWVQVAGKDQSLGQVRGQLIKQYLLQRVQLPEADVEITLEMPANLATDQVWIGAARP